MFQIKKVIIYIQLSKQVSVMTQTIHFVTSLNLSTLYSNHRTLKRYPMQLKNCGDFITLT